MRKAKEVGGRPLPWGGGGSRAREDVPPWVPPPASSSPTRYRNPSPPMLKRRHSSCSSRRSASGGSGYHTRGSTPNAGRKSKVGREDRSIYSTNSSRRGRSGFEGVSTHSGLSSRSISPMRPGRGVEDTHKQHARHVQMMEANIHKELEELDSALYRKKQYSSTQLSYSREEDIVISDVDFEDPEVDLDGEDTVVDMRHIEQKIATKTTSYLSPTHPTPPTLSKTWKSLMSSMVLRLHDTSSLDPLTDPSLRQTTLSTSLNEILGYTGGHYEVARSQCDARRELVTQLTQMLM